MNLNNGFTFSCLGVFGAFLAIIQASKVQRSLGPSISRWLIRHIVLPRLFRGRYVFNPTRLEVLCHLFHWTATILWNTLGVTDFSHAAARAGRIAVVHIVPLTIAYQLSFVSQSLRLRLRATVKIHRSLAFMATLHGALHIAIQWQMAGAHNRLTLLQIMACICLLTLSISPLLRRYYSYEMFLYSHRALTIVLLVLLWEHIRTRPTLSRTILAGTFAGLLASTTLQNVRQLYQNLLVDRHGFRLIRTNQSRQCGDSLIVEIRLSRPWNIRPGQYVYLSLLTLKCASIFQRHPFVITWWDNADNRGKTSDNQAELGNNKDKAKVLYIMIDPQNGWTRSAMARQSIFTAQIAWLDGPFGVPYELEEYGVVMLFASGNGIFAQLPILKSLIEKVKCSAANTRRVKLVWQTEIFHEQLQDWMHVLLRDDQIDKQLLDISIHQPGLSNAKHPETPKVFKMTDRVRVIYDVPNIDEYIQLELEDTRKSAAVTVSEHGQLRHDVRKGIVQKIVQLSRSNVVQQYDECS